MKRILYRILVLALCLGCLGCNNIDKQAQIVATTLPVYEITTRLCQDTQLQIARLISENVSCLHDYTLNPTQMKLAESAELLVISGAGFEGFLGDVTSRAAAIADASEGIILHGGEDDHHHQHDPHIWLSPENGQKMAENIYAALCKVYPQQKPRFQKNLAALQAELDALALYGKNQLSSLRCRQLITFHDGFSYMANFYGLEILHSVEEESGSEASAADLIGICSLVEQHNIPAIFVETNGSDRAASIISAETGAKVYPLDTGLSGAGYLEAMYRNIDTLKEALE